MISIRGSLLLTIGLLFCILGCTRDRADVLIPDHIPPSTEVHETFNAEMSFEQNVLRFSRRNVPLLDATSLMDLMV